MDKPPVITPWTEELPHDWALQRLAKVASVVFSNVDKHTKEDEIPVRLCNYVDVYRYDRINEDIDFMEATASENEIKRFTLSKDDVLATKDSEDPFDIAISSVVSNNLKGVLCGYHLAILRANKRDLYGPFLLWLHSSKGFRAHYEAHATGVTRFGVSRKVFKSCPIPIPPIDEQRQIAAYLDASCAVIDKAVETKKRQLEILDDLRKSVIHKAITQGLTPNAEMQETGVGWLGKIPKHWRVARIKRHAKMIRGKFSHRPRNDPALYDGPYPFIQTGSIASAEKYITEYNQTLNSAGLAVSRMFPKGTIVMSIAANIGDVAIMDIEACFPDSIIGFVPDHHLYPDYLFYLLKSMKPVMLRSAIITTQLNINYVRIGGNYCPIPPYKEQEAIAREIDRRMVELRRLSDTLTDQIKTLTAYQKSLIHECITGKRRISETDLAKVKAHV